MTRFKKLEWLLRVGVFGEFLGHGLLAVMGKTEWVEWVRAALGVSTSTATTLLLLVGILDVVLALIVLVQPKPLSWVLLIAAFWGFWTALARPLLGNSVLDFVERSANWAAPLALFYFYKESTRP